MSGRGELTKVMVKHHGKIEKALRDFEESVGSDCAGKLFNDFKWELEKHFFVEERAILTYYNPEDEESNAMKTTVLDDHRMILDELKGVERGLGTGSDGLEDFKVHLREHAHFEDAVLYPKMDADLEPEEKDEMLSRITNPM